MKISGNRLFSLVCPKGHYTLVRKTSKADYSHFCIDFSEREYLRIRIVCAKCDYVFYSKKIKAEN